MIEQLQISGLNHKLHLMLMVASFWLLSSGCTLTDNLAKTTIIQPAQFCNYLDEKRQKHNFRKLARQELERARATARAERDDYHCQPFSVDEELGFEDGFVDFMVYGGTGNPPPLPPRRYWRIKYQNPAGFQAIQDWNQGYQHGTAVARASGYRDFVTIALNDSLIKETLPYYGRGEEEIEQIEPKQPPADGSEDDQAVNDAAVQPEHPQSPFTSEFVLPSEPIPPKPRTTRASALLDNKHVPDGLLLESFHGSQFQENDPSSPPVSKSPDDGGSTSQPATPNQGNSLSIPLINPASYDAQTTDLSINREQFIPIAAEHSTITRLPPLPASQESTGQHQSSVNVKQPARIDTKLKLLENGIPARSDQVSLPVVEPAFLPANTVVPDCFISPLPPLNLEFAPEVVPASSKVKRNDKE